MKVLQIKRQHVLQDMKSFFFLTSRFKHYKIFFVVSSHPANQTDLNEVSINFLAMSKMKWRDSF